VYVGAYFPTDFLVTRNSDAMETPCAMETFCAMETLMRQRLLGDEISDAMETSCAMETHCGGASDTTRLL